MDLELDFQVALESDDPLSERMPSEEQVRQWVEAAVSGHRDQAQLAVRVVGEAEGRMLNETYRGKAGPTNVLSFPFDAPPGVNLPLLGDIVICAPVVEREAAEQGKPLEAHWAHMVIHGCLHLLGFDHIEAEQAEEMETLETRILADLRYANPYE